ncbi:hypothetical protein BDW59DRAFT_163300 [Aspergillus cavernicola]|uniref:Centrosomin N-terminal motif 1 domain-containing protein n=1 Tax=Aspergillus cavernicola TaxID=176166 RepID=A0ABR4I8W9_9EURO
MARDSTRRTGGRKIRLSILPTNFNGSINYPDLLTEEKTLEEIFNNLNDKERVETTRAQVKYHFEALGDQLDEAYQKLAAAELQIKQLNAQPDNTLMMRDLAHLETIITDKDTIIQARDDEITALNKRINTLND